MSNVINIFSKRVVSTTPLNVEQVYEKYLYDKYFFGRDTTEGRAEYEKHFKNQLGFTGELFNSIDQVLEERLKAMAIPWNGLSQETLNGSEIGGFAGYLYFETDSERHWPTIVLHTHFYEVLPDLTISTLFRLVERITPYNKGDVLQHAEALTNKESACERWDCTKLLKPFVEHVIEGDLVTLDDDALTDTLSAYSFHTDYGYFDFIINKQLQLVSN